MYQISIAVLAWVQSLTNTLALNGAKQTIFGTSWNDQLFSDTVCFFVAGRVICTGVAHSFSPVLCLAELGACECGGWGEVSVIVLCCSATNT